MRYDPDLAAGPDPDGSPAPAGASSMVGVNGYLYQLSDAEIEGGGHRELAGAGLEDRGVRLHQTDRFDATVYGVTFDYGVSVSLLTRLAANHITLCFSAARGVLLLHPGLLPLRPRGDGRVRRPRRPAVRPPRRLGPPARP